MASIELRAAAEQALDKLDSILLSSSLARSNDGVTLGQYMEAKAASRELRAALTLPERTLTDEVIAELWHKNGGFHHHFARAIERWLRGHA